MAFVTIVGYNSGSDKYLVRQALTVPEQGEPHWSDDLYELSGIWIRSSNRIASHDIRDVSSDLLIPINDETVISSYVPVP